jgi:sulfur relay (sulfurtransferase) complex TusBCD TusD component (DsrE family)
MVGDAAGRSLEDGRWLVRLALLFIHCGARVSVRGGNPRGSPAYFKRAFLATIRTSAAGLLAVHICRTAAKARGIASHAGLATRIAAGELRATRHKIGLHGIAA